MILYIQASTQSCLSDLCIQFSVNMILSSNILKLSGFTMLHFDTPGRSLALFTICLGRLAHSANPVELGIHLNLAKDF